MPISLFRRSLWVIVPLMGAWLTLITLRGEDQRVVAGGPAPYSSASPLARGGPGMRGTFNVMDYGARGDGKTDDSAAIQRTFAAAQSSGASPHSRPVVQFPPLPFHIAKAIDVARNIDIESLGHTELIGDGNDGFTTPQAFRLTIRGFSFSNVGTALRLSTLNVDTSMITIEDCSFEKGCKVGIDSVSFDLSRSTVLTVRNCFSDAERFLKAYTDMLNIENCWINHDGGNHESMVIDSRANISGSMFIPAGLADQGDAPDRCWIIFKASDYSRGLRAQGCRFSGEQGGGFTVLHNFAKGNPDYLAEVGSQICISFNDCELDTLRSAQGRQSPVVLFAMPNSISMHNCSGTIARGLVSLGPGFTPPAPPRAGEMQLYSLDFDGPSRRMTNQLREFGGVRPVTAALLPFVRGN